MREARWVDRFLFAWSNSLFYDPLETHYVPAPDHFLHQFDEEIRKRFVRSGIWWSYRHNANLPTQGWKIHVSANQRNARHVAEAVIGYLVGRNVDFKIALDLNIFEMLSLKSMARGNAGKLITIYPATVEEFRDCLRELSEILAGAWGAYILSDLRYKDGRSLYFRYGQLLDTHSVDVMGRKVPYILDPEGQLFADPRQAVFSTPPWVEWPFEDWAPQDHVEAIDLVGGRFRVVEAIRFSNSGGVYKAEDVNDDDRLVVLKEARPGTNANPREDYDAVGVLKREWEFLGRLADSGLFPAPVALFQEWEHWFIAEEFIDGVDIRLILFDHNPLVRPHFDSSDSREFLRIFLKILKGLASAVAAAHERGVVLGDLSPTNLIVQPDTFGVRVVDLEASRLVDEGEEGRHLQTAVDLYTAGFSRSRDVGRRVTVEDDLYGIATTMAYFIFPIAAMSYLRDDVFSLYRHYVDDLGWPREIHQLLTSLAEGTGSLESAIKLASEEDTWLERVEIRPPASVEESELRLPEIEQRLAAFVTESADAGRATLFPADPFAHLTNPLSLGFGASGVLYALHLCGIDLRPDWLPWLRHRLSELDAAEYPAGLMPGLAGLAWASDGIGLRADADHLLATANAAALSLEDYTFYYGLAGLGMTNLHFYARRNSVQYLQAAEVCAKELCARAQHDGGHAYWLNDFATEGPLTGLGFGQAGVALFLLRMFQATRNDAYLRLGEQALDWEIAHAEEWFGDSITFRHEKTLMPYAEVGSAGVAQVLLRYRRLDTAEQVLRGVRQVRSSMPGYFFGMSGIIDAMLDAATVLRDPSYRDAALRQFQYIKNIFLFEPPSPSAVASTGEAPSLAVPGEGLLRCACDLATGSAGVLRVVHRLHHGGPSDFLLDELGS